LAYNFAAIVNSVGQRLCAGTSNVQTLRQAADRDLT